MVPLVAARLAAGKGSLETEGEVLSYFSFRNDWLSRKGDPDKMVLMKVCGDSMEPDIRHGDMVLVDQSKSQIYGHAIYAMGINEEIYIKQVETLPGGKLVLRSRNPEYEPIHVDLHGDLADSVRVIGRVIWYCREI
jgi:phage repressor protein C with HTH and peptisase S24 domain